MALNWDKWMRDMPGGLKANLTCRYLLIQSAVTLFLLTFVSVGMMLI